MFNLLTIVLKLASVVASYLERKQLMDAGADKVIKNNLQESLKRVKSAKESTARSRADKSIVKRLRDKYKRN